MSAITRPVDDWNIEFLWAKKNLQKKSLLFCSPLIGAIVCLYLFYLDEMNYSIHSQNFGQLRSSIGNQITSDVAISFSTDESLK